MIDLFNVVYDVTVIKYFVMLIHKRVTIRGQNCTNYAGGHL